MTPIEVLQHALADGVSVSLNGADQVKITGDEDIVNKWLPAIRDNKADIMAAISPLETNNRTWTEGNPFTCKCGYATGWTLDGKTLCPVCYHDKFKPPQQENVLKPKDRPRHAKPSIVALAWLQDHRKALDNAGWTRVELYSRKKYCRGLAWLDLWDQAFIMAFLHKDGTIEFECSRHGRDYFQTARPRAYYKKKEGAE